MRKAKRQQRQPNRVVDPATQVSSAGAPTIRMTIPQPSTNDAAASSPTSAAAQRSAQSLAGERAAMRNQRTMMLAGLGALVLIGGALILFLRPFGETEATSTAMTVQATAAPVVQATTAPVVQAAVAPTTLQPTLTAPTAPPTIAPAVAQTGGLPASTGIACSDIAGLPAFANARCIDQDTEHDDGLIKIENTYATPASSDELRRFYEQAFTQNGWTIQEFQYNLNIGARQLKIVVEAEQEPTGTFTKIHLTEDGAAAGSANTCSAIAGLAIYPNATCVDHDLDQDDGVFKIKSTYTVAATPDQVRSFYAQALAQNGWAPQEFSHDITQGARRIQVSAEAQPGPSGSFTQFKIAEK